MANRCLRIPCVVYGAAPLSVTGQLELFIPWKRLTKDPLIVKIEDVYAIVTPDLCTSERSGAARDIVFVNMCVCV